VLIYINLQQALEGLSFLHINLLRCSQCLTLIFLSPAAVPADGVEFVESANGVVLSPGVDGVLHPKYFARVVDSRTGQSLL
jgi:2'-phosphotransferase